MSGFVASNRPIAIFRCELLHISRDKLKLRPDPASGLDRASECVSALPIDTVAMQFVDHAPGSAALQSWGGEDSKKRPIPVERRIQPRIVGAAIQEISCRRDLL